MADSQNGVVERSYSCLPLILEHMPDIDERRDVLSVEYINGVFVVSLKRYDDADRLVRRERVAMLNEDGSEFDRIAYMRRKYPKPTSNAEAVSAAGN